MDGWMDGWCVRYVPCPFERGKCTSPSGGWRGRRLSDESYVMGVYMGLFAVAFTRGRHTRSKLNRGVVLRCPPRFEREARCRGILR